MRLARPRPLEHFEEEVERRPEHYVDIDTGKPGTLLRVSSIGNNGSTGGNDHLVNASYPGLQSEAAIAVNGAGTVLVAGYNDPAGFDLTPVQLSGVARSIDGGQTWIASGPLPCPANAKLYGDPDVKYDAVGDRFFYSSIYVDPATNQQAMCVHRSDASGLNWSGPFMVPGSSVANTPADKEMIAVNSGTGRLIMTWVQVASIRSLMTSYTDDGGATWSTPITVASNAGIQAPQIRFIAGPSNATSSVYVAYFQSSTFRVVRSTDGGATWGTPITIRSGVPTPDEVIGFDRAHAMCAMDVDPATAMVYVTYPIPDATGTTDVELVSGSGTTFSAPVKIDSNPGNDRAQIRPAIAVDASTHRVHVTWYDQDGAASGDLTELMHTYSDDAGATWSRPTPLFDRPFHAAYGDDGGEPNLGDYNECVAQNGVLHSIAGKTKDQVLFDDAQPSASMGAVDTYHDRLPQGPAPGFNLLSRSDDSTAANPSWVDTADLNGDGFPDLVTSNFSNSVSVRLGDGAGNFGIATTYAVPGGPVAVALRDLNHDGRVDIVTANNTAGTLAVLLNAGAGSFGPATIYASGSGTSGVAIGDVNGDTHPDLVASNYAARTITVFLGNGAGGFGAPTAFPTASGPNWIALGDLDGDSKLDLVTANPAANTVTVRLGNGLGGFAPGTDYAVGTSPATLLVADLNGDGKLDVATANYLAATVSVLLGNGAGGLAPRTDFATPVAPGSVACGDVDGDGIVDLAVSHDSPAGVISVLRGLGGGSFETPASFAVGSNNWAVRLTDVSGDGIPDLLSANYGAASVSVLLGKGSAPGDYEAASLRLAALTISDPCNGSNGRLDPGETASLTCSLRNYVANPVDSPITYTGVQATLSSPTPGVTVRLAQQSYGPIAPLASVSNAVPFRLSLDPTFVPGTDVELLLTVRTDQGVARLRRRIATGSPGAPTTLIKEDFNGAVAPALPVGWSSVYASGTSNPWVTSTTIPGVGAGGSQAAFHGNSGILGWNRLWSPAVTVPTPPAGVQCYVTLDFDLAYSLESEPTKKVLAYDGCYLRIHDLTGGAYTVRSINADAFAEEFHSGSLDGYSGRFARGGIPFATANLWSGSSQGLQHVAMKFPGAGLAGHTIQLRFEFQEDGGGTCTSAGLAGPCGVSIDNVVLQYVPVVSQPCSPVSVPRGGALALALDRIWPNPSTGGHLSVRFTLPASADASLALYDVMGRVVRQRALRGLAPGDHVVDLTGASPISPGVYFVRLGQSGQSRTGRVVVLH